MVVAVLMVFYHICAVFNGSLMRMAVQSEWVFMNIAVRQAPLCPAVKLAARCRELI